MDEKISRRKFFRNSMPESCAPGSAILNVDNGYGADSTSARVINNL